LARRQALCVGIMSYNGQVNFGLVGDYDAMADLDSFALDLEAAAGELVDATPAARKSKPKAAAKAGASSSNGAGPVAVEESA
ncbi:MAG: diacylglycerol O-acyltransferase / wax synthase, partial [Solirubrobacterales bacterium]|nr:diacylglycerol O-acyltransferase / wax synthase [Solirubrobacterales bacterium]